MKQNLFVSDAIPPYFFKIKKAAFSTNGNKIKKINLTILNKAEEKIELLLSKDFIFDDYSNELKINLDLKNFNLRLGKLYIKVSEDGEDLEKIKDITLKVVPHYDLSNFKILEKFNNCYFLEKLS